MLDELLVLLTALLVELLPLFFLEPFMLGALLCIPDSMHGVLSNLFLHLVEEVQSERWPSQCLRLCL